MKFTAALVFATVASAAARNCTTMREEIDPAGATCMASCFPYNGTHYFISFSDTAVEDIVEAWACPQFCVGTALNLLADDEWPSISKTHAYFSGFLSKKTINNCFCHNILHDMGQGDNRVRR